VNEYLSYISSPITLKSWLVKNREHKELQCFQLILYWKQNIFLRIMNWRFIWFSDFIFKCCLAKPNYHLEQFKHKTHSSLISERYTLNSKIISTNFRWIEMNKHKATLKKTLQCNNLLKSCLHFTEAINKVNRGLREIVAAAEFQSNTVMIYP
jgi:hypothetical protein